MGYVEHPIYLPGPTVEIVSLISFFFSSKILERFFVVWRVHFAEGETRLHMKKIYLFPCFGFSCCLFICWVFLFFLFFWKKKFDFYCMMMKIAMHNFVFDGCSQYCIFLKCSPNYNQIHLLISS